MDQMDESLALTATANQPAKARIYSEEEWEAQKSNFEKLYKSNSLPDVIIAMQHDHGFTATPRQYKRRIQKWGFDKNVKGYEMMTIAAQQVKRKQEIGKDSLFILRDRKVTCGKIKRYMKRRKIHESDLLLSVIPTADSTIAVTCNTPSPDGSDSSQLVSTEATIPGTDFPEPYDFLYTRPRSSSTFCHLQIKCNSIEDNGDKEFFNISPSPHQSKAQFDTDLISLRDQEGSNPSLLLSHCQSTNRGIVRCSSPSFSDTATEILERFSPRVTPGILSPSLPSCKLPGFEENISFFEKLDSSKSTPYFDEVYIPGSECRELPGMISSLLEAMQVLVGADAKNDAHIMIRIILGHIQRMNSVPLVNSTFEHNSIEETISGPATFDFPERACEWYILALLVGRYQLQLQVSELALTHLFLQRYNNQHETFVTAVFHLSLILEALDQFGAIFCAQNSSSRGGDMLERNIRILSLKLLSRMQKIVQLSQGRRTTPSAIPRLVLESYTELEKVVMDRKAFGVNRDVARFFDILLAVVFWVERYYG